MQLLPTNSISTAFSTDLPEATVQVVLLLVIDLRAYEPPEGSVTVDPVESVISAARPK